ncbi:MAG: class I SAM-dependent methyltransferase [Bacteroidetes bacterium]|nr:class I SAM-dependent methyltransferase [Bacteroidota bacterium]
MVITEMSDYKEIEKERYNSRAKASLSKLNQKQLLSWGYQSLPPYLQAPYKFYHETIASKTFPGAKILDICCGDGLHSYTGKLYGGDVTVTDIAECNVMLTIEKGRLLGFEIEGIVADMDDLCVGNESFDIATCAGSMSYLELSTFVPKVKLMLKSGGYFIAVDSFNHNPIYRVNRYIHFLRGNRTSRVNQNIPSEETIAHIKTYFDEVEVKYFGVFTFAALFLKPFFSPDKLASVLNRLDKTFSLLKKYSFKIVIIAKNK